VLIPAVLFAILSGNTPYLWLGNWPFLLMLSLAVVMLSIEWGGMTAPAARTGVAAAVTLAVLVGLYLPWLSSARWAWTAAWVWLPVGAGLAALAAIRLGAPPSEAAYGVFYIGAPSLALAWLRAMPNPISWTLLLLAVTWSADICAFLVGNAIKGPKIWPQWSPNKTWSGFIGGLVGAVLAALGVVWVTAHNHGAQLTFAFASSVGLAGGLATMFGDLWESVLKRRYGVKDSGDLIPGHGGLLDRVDGLMIAILAVAGARLIHQIGWAQ
jgi:phosphatidate cytidylyltransferase